MNDVKLLDCTLRDGGYQNDWNFGHDNLVSIFERVVEANADFIEVGFLDERRNFDINRSIMPDTDSVRKIYGDLDRKNTTVVAMIDYGTCSLKNIKPESESFLDGIRVIFKKKKYREALEFCGELEKLGYKVFAQLVSVTSYDDREMMELIELANQIKPYAVSMVDTYGLMNCDNLMHYFTILNDNLDPEIALGYHAHNNFQLGFANCISMLSCETQRTVLVDGSLYGMGKSAGNTPTELIAMHMNEKFGKNFQISQFLEAIDSNIMQFTSLPAWGYSMFYFIAALNHCHPNYVSYLMNKRTLSVKSINEILGMLENEKKLLFDKDYIEQIYTQYQTNDINDDEARKQLAEIMSGKNIMIMGPGKSIQTEKNRIKDFYRKNHPLVISINCILEYINPDYIFISNSKRYVQLATSLSKKKYSVIATSNVTDSGQTFDYVLNIGPLLDLSAEFIDNSLVMLLKVLCDLGVERVYLAGFDGYSSSSANYYNANMEYDFAKQKADYLNKYTSDFILSIKNKLPVEFVTESKYCGEYNEE